MNDSKIATRYSKAIFLIAREKGKLDELKSDMEYILKNFHNNDVRLLLHNPLLNAKEKYDILHEAFGDEMGELTYQFIKLLLNNNREDKVESIARSFIDHYRKEKKIKSVVLTTAGPLDDKIRRKFVEWVETNYQCKADLKEIQKKELIGGFVLDVEGIKFDASVATKLKEIRKDLLSKTR